jgi:hypothetical protein
MEPSSGSCSVHRRSTHRGYDIPRELALSRRGERLGNRWIVVAPVYLKAEALFVVRKPVPYIFVHQASIEEPGKQQNYLSWRSGMRVKYSTLLLAELVDCSTALA